MHASGALRDERTPKGASEDADRGLFAPLRLFYQKQNKYF